MVLQGMKESVKQTFGEDALSLFGEEESSSSGGLQISNKVKKGTELTLTGKPHRSWAIGGIVFTITAKKKMFLSGLSVYSRVAGSWPIEIISKEGRIKQDLGNKSEWKVVQEKKTINFANITSPTRIWEGNIVFKKDQAITFAICNQGNTSDGEIVMDGNVINTFPPTVLDTTNNNDIAISQVFFLDRSSGTFTYYPSIHCGDFCGTVHYKL